MSEKRARLKHLIAGEKIIVAPGVYDSLGARIVESVGFDAIYITGFGISTSFLGMPDMGLLTLNECVRQAINIDNVTTRPVIADAESGFGNACNVMRTTAEYEKAGIAAIHIEDTIFPRVWKPDGRPHVVSAEEHADKIRAAVEARKDRNFLIIGRTDAIERYGLAEAIKRANIYHEAGADAIFVHGAASQDELKAICKEVKAPNIINYANIIERGYQPPLIAELEELGFKIVIFPTQLLLCATKIMRETLIHLSSVGSMDGWIDKQIPLDELFSIMAWSKYGGYNSCD